MKYIKENSIFDFQFWGGAKDVAARLTTDELESLDDYFDSIQDDNMLLTDTQINDMFWFELDYILELIGSEETKDEFVSRDINSPVFLNR